MPKFVHPTMPKPHWNITSVRTNFNRSFQRVMGNSLEEHLMRTSRKKICESIKSTPYFRLLNIMEKEALIGDIIILFQWKLIIFEWNLGKTKDVKRCVRKPTQPTWCTFKTISGVGQWYMVLVSSAKTISNFQYLFCIKIKNI